MLQSGGVLKIWKKIMTHIRSLLGFFYAHYEYEKQYSYLKAGENARITSNHPNNYLSLAYQFHLSGMFSKIIGVSDKQASLFKSVIKNYQFSLKYLKENTIARELISAPGDSLRWDNIVSAFSDFFLEGDTNQILASYGGRSYKNATPLPTCFDRAESEIRISEAIMMYEAILRKYKPSGDILEGFSNFYYPHFEYQGALLNHHLYSYETALYVEKAELPKNIVAEIGAGDGAVAREMLKTGTSKYIIFDIPEILTRSNLFLSDYFEGTKKVAGIVEYKSNNYSILKTLEEFDVLCLPCWFAENIDVDVDMWINTHSLGEMPLKISQHYVDIIDRTGKAFLSINSETVRTYSSRKINASADYLSRLKNLKLRASDFPITSNHFFLDPYYSRHLFTKNNNSSSVR